LQGLFVLCERKKLQNRMATETRLDGFEAGGFRPSSMNQ